MEKTLVYVDGENVSVGQFEDFLSLLEECGLHNRDGERCMVVGKVYGNRNAVGGVLSRCIEEGYEFVDTNLLASNFKNVTDMKIVVDCISDVMSIYLNDVNCVYIVSADHDFVPLILKLRGQHLRVEAPFLEFTIEQKTCADLSKYLTSHCFEAFARKKILENPFFMLKEFTNGEFQDDVVSDFLSKKRKRVASCVLSSFGPCAAEAVINIPVSEFTFDSLSVSLDSFGIPAIDLFELYTKKMYGICLPREDTLNELERRIS